MGAILGAIRLFNPNLNLGPLEAVSASMRGRESIELRLQVAGLAEEGTLRYAFQVTDDTFDSGDTEN
jgi:hypothetical protein